MTAARPLTHTWHTPGGCTCPPVTTTGSGHTLTDDVTGDLARDDNGHVLWFVTFVGCPRHGDRERDYEADDLEHLVDWRHAQDRYEHGWWGE